MIPWREVFGDLVEVVSLKLAVAFVLAYVLGLGGLILLATIG